MTAPFVNDGTASDSTAGDGTARDGGAEGTVPGRRTVPWPAMVDRRGTVVPEVSVVVPTYNEAGNLPALLERLDLTLAHLDYEIVVVDDDSPDGTWRLAADLAARSPRLRVLRRVGRRGLSSAVLEGMSLARGRVLAVIDADLQHDEAVLPAMVAAVGRGRADVCIGSRSAPGGSYGTFGPSRRLVSWAGAQLARSVAGVHVSDPMSGFFAISRERYELVAADMTGRGFKILLELLARGPRPVVTEVGYRFRERTAGTTKLTSAVVGQYLTAVLELALGRAGMARLPTYGALALVAASIRASLWSLPDTPSGWTLIGAEAAILAEFAFHNRATFAPVRHRGWHRLGPLLRFHLVSLYGLVALAGVGALLQNHLLASVPTPPRLAAALGLATLAMLGSVAAAYLLNTRLVWPWGGAQTSRPTTVSTSRSISATALR